MSNVRRIGMWLGHYEAWVFGVMFAGCLALGWLGLDYATLSAVVALAVVANVGVIMHDRRLCERCGSSIDEALNPSESVERQRWPLRYHHAAALRVLLFLAAFVLVLLSPWGVVGAVALNAMGVMMVYGIFAQRVHGRLMPWCPYCDHGDGWDDDEEEVSPDPQPVGGER